MLTHNPVDVVEYLPFPNKVQERSKYEVLVIHYSYLCIDDLVTQ